MYCTKCGKEFEGNFCPNCGTKAFANIKENSTKNVKTELKEKPLEKKLWTKRHPVATGVLIFLLIWCIYSIATSTMDSNPVISFIQGLFQGIIQPFKNFAEIFSGK